MKLGETTTKSRQLVTRFAGTDATVTLPPFGTGIPAITKTANVVVGGQKTTSTSTIWPYVKKARSLYAGTKLNFDSVDAGANFFTSKSYTDLPYRGSIYRRLNSSTSDSWEGTFSAYTVVNVSEIAMLSGLTISEQQRLLAYGTTAIARCIPTNPISGLANFLGELRRDGLPFLPGESMQQAFEKSRGPGKGSGNEYLNLQFALKPFLSDISKFATVAHTHDKVLKQYLKDSGKLIRRKYRFPTEHSYTVSTVSTNYRPSGIPTKYFATGGTLTKEVETSTDRWFSGGFCYYLNLDDSILGKLESFEQKSNKLLGTRLNPELAWNLAPWSWAMDWFSNAGDVFHNVSAFLSDGLVMRYGYVMEHSTITTTYTLSGYTLHSGVYANTIPSTLRQTFTQERKVRMRASPFGFGKLVGDLSPRQLAIIASLGITRNGGVAK